MRSASVYLRDGQLFLNSESRTTAGVWIGVHPVTVVRSDVSFEMKGELLLQALAGSDVDVSHPTDWAALVQPLLTSAGVKSWSAFAKRASSCHVTADNGTIVLRPYRRHGNRGFFLEIPDHAISLSEPSEAALGEALDACLRVSASQ